MSEKRNEKYTAACLSWTDDPMVINDATAYVCRDCGALVAGIIEHNQRCRDYLT